MAEFLVTSIELQLLEKIITKLEWKSYFRLQQTCKQMEKMARTNKNIKGIRVDKVVQCYTDTGIYSINRCDGEDIYGVCWKELYIEVVEELRYGLLGRLERNRITCQKLEYYRRSGMRWGVKKLKKMLEVLKPESFERHDHKDNFYPTFNLLFQAKELKEVDIKMEWRCPREIYQNVARLVSHFCKVDLFVFPTELTQEEVYYLVSRILQYINSEPIPQFKSMHLTLSFRNFVGLSSTDYLHALLRSHKPSVDAAPNLNKTDYEITIGDYNYKEHTFIETSTAVLDLSAINMTCKIECRRMHYHGVVMKGPTNWITIQRI